MNEKNKKLKREKELKNKHTLKKKLKLVTRNVFTKFWNKKPAESN